MKDYKQWVVWQKSMELVTETYSLTKHFPKEEVYGLTSQIRRAAVSIPSNIAEGYARFSSKDKHHFYVIAYASAKEYETQLEIANRLGFAKTIDIERINCIYTEVIKLLSKMVFPRA